MYSTLNLSTLLSLLAIATCQQCGLLANNANGPPPFLDYGNTDLIHHLHQAIIPSYRFNCCGNIMEWGVDVHPAGGGDDGLYTLDLQVWRPAPNVTSTGCYSLVGNNRFTSITLMNQVAVVTPLPQNRIQFESGDVLGFFVESAHERPDDRGVVILSDRINRGDGGYETEEVWYADMSNPVIGNAMCPFPVGSNRVLSSFTDAAPVISVSVSATICPVNIPSPTVVGTEGPLATTVPGNVPSTGPPTIIDNNDNSNVGIIAGTIVTVTLITVIITLTIVVLVWTFQRRNMSSYDSKESGLANPSYGAGGRSKKLSRPKLPPIDTTNIAVYESLDAAEYNDIPLDYTYPTPSPTSKYDPERDTAYTYIPNNGHTVPSLNKKLEPTVATSNGVHGNMRNVYHLIGPDVVQHYEFENNNGVAGGGGRDGVISKGALSRPNGNGTNNSYYLNTEFGSDAGVVVYEDPTLPKFREEMSSAGLFETAGNYVPTVEQRVALGNHYELADEPDPKYNKLKFFIEDQIYWAPASTTSDLYSQLASKKYREIPRSQIIILEQLGSGQFGQVCKGVWSVAELTMELAVKTLKPGAPEGEKVKLLQEAAIMGQFSHPNVVKLYGVVTVGEPVMICLELMSNGDLRSYIQSIDIKSRPFNDLQLLFLRFAKEIASGMNYLSKKSFIHRDLAARNVLLDRTLTCKIGDFGMARDLMDDTYYKSSGGKIPVKWTSPEALLYKKYSTDSDVWSYGMVLFEIWSVGKKPFSQFTNNQVLKLVQTGHCQSPPPGCPRAIYKLMVDCWHPAHQHRPSFDVISMYLQQPTGTLVHWNEKDNLIEEDVNVLGADLYAGMQLYPDLQETYKESDYEEAP